MCYTLMHSGVDPLVFIPKCIAYEIIESEMCATGPVIFQTNETRMELALSDIRKVIALNGADVFEKLLKVLRSELTGIYNELADYMESMYVLASYVAICIYSNYVHT